MVKQLFEQLETTLKTNDKKKVVFPESGDERILKAVHRLYSNGLVEPILIGDEKNVSEQLDSLGFDPSFCQIINPTTYNDLELMKEKFIERRNGKVSVEEAEIVLQDANYFATMLVYLNKADGLVSGAVHSTSDTVRPALQIIKTVQGIRKTSGVFIMTRGEERYVFADCAINIAPASEDLAEIAVLSAKTAALFDIDPKIAMLSFSTKGSAKSEETNRVKDSVQLALDIDNTLTIDGEIQFDAAFVPNVAEKKAKDSPLQGQANTFIFPSLEAGNIGYKIAERMGGFEAVGPILQGLNQPVNDLSRGCSEEDVYKLAVITAIQAFQD